MPTTLQSIRVSWALLSHLASDLRINRALASDLREDGSKAIRIIQRIVFGSAVVKAKYLFGDIAIKMSHVGSAKGLRFNRLQKFSMP